MRSRPDSGSCRPAIKSRMVVFPTPEGPMMATNEPAGTWNEISVKTGRLSYPNETDSNSIPRRRLGAASVPQAGSAMASAWAINSSRDQKALSVTASASYSNCTKWIRPASRWNRNAITRISAKDTPPISTAASMPTAIIVMSTGSWNERSDSDAMTWLLSASSRATMSSVTRSWNLSSRPIALIGLML